MIVFLFGMGLLLIKSKQESCPFLGYGFYLKRYLITLDVICLQKINVSEKIYNRWQLRLSHRECPQQAPPIQHNVLF